MKLFSILFFRNRNCQQNQLNRCVYLQVDCNLSVCFHTIFQPKEFIYLFLLVQDQLYQLFLLSFLLCFYIIMRDTSRNVGLKKKIQNNHILEELHKSRHKNIEELHNYYYYNTEELHFFLEAGYVF